MNKKDENQSALFEDIPVDNAVAERTKRFTNCLAEIFNEIISERKINLAKVQRETEIPFPTIDDWCRGKSIPLTDENIMVLAKYLNISLEYLLYGIGTGATLETKILRLANYLRMDAEKITEIMEGEDEFTNMAG